MQSDRVPISCGHQLMCSYLVRLVLLLKKYLKAIISKRYLMHRTWFCSLMIMKTQLLIQLEIRVFKLSVLLYYIVNSIYLSKYFFFVFLIFHMNRYNLLLNVRHVLNIPNPLKIDEHGCGHSFVVLYNLSRKLNFWLFPG